MTMNTSVVILNSRTGWDISLYVFVAYMLNKMILGTSIYVLGELYSTVMHC